MKSSFIFLLLALFLFLTAGCVSKPPEDGSEVIESPEVEEGDVVLVNYIQRVYDTGELVATSFGDIARDQKVAKSKGFQEAESYGPINITVGSGIMPTVEDAMIGTRIGDEKEILIPPEDAYGNRLSELIRVIPRVAVLPKIVEVPVGEFDKTLEIGEYVQLKYWQAKVVEVTDDYVALRNEPDDGSTINAKYGPAAVTVNATHVITTLTPVIDSIVDTPFGPAKVMDYDDTIVTLDHNHPLAGKTLLFEVRIEGIEKSK